MSHCFIKQADGSKMCSNCGDEVGKNNERACPFPSATPQQSGNVIYERKQYLIILKSSLLIYDNVYNLFFICHSY